MEPTFIRKDLEFKRNVQSDFSGLKSETLTVTLEFVSNGNTSVITNEELLKKLVDKISEEI